MNWFAAVLALPFALAIGSFLNVVAARLPRGESLTRPGSHCMSCEQAIAWYDNVPILSWLALRGRCRRCGAAVSWRYPALEAIAAALISAVVLRFGFTPQAALYAVFVAALIALAAIDIEYHILPNRIVLPLFGVVYAGQIVLQPDRVLEWTLAALGAAGFLLAFALAYPAGMGMGDVKLALVLGAALGFSVVVAMMVGVVAAGLLGVAVIARHGSAGRKVAVPLGPFLALGAVVGLFAGPELLDVYTGTWS
ncbi:MAG: prepilin peptidase [Thermoleophilia bacterium]|nr:prepilin peptidase [Thermoleophilia bacterium]